MKLLVNAARRVHFLAAAIVGGATFLVLSLLGLVFAAVLPGSAQKAPFLFARSLGAVLRAVLGWRIDAEGTDAFETPAVIVANHQSNLDIVTYGSVFPRRARAVGKKELGRVPLFGWFFGRTGNILIDRSKAEKARATLEEAGRRIREEGISIWMFPEGHRNQKRELLPFKKGAFHLAVAAGVPVLPVVSEPIGVLLDAHRLLVRPGRFRIHVLEPISTAGRSVDDVDALIAETRAVMQERSDRLAETARPRIP